MPIVLAWVGFPDVHEDGLYAVVGILVGDDVEGWARQPTVWSGE
jgi:hypothetical protein